MSMAVTVVVTLFTGKHAEHGHASWSSVEYDTNTGMMGPSGYMMICLVLVSCAL